MPLLAKDKGGSDFEPLDKGLHQAICYGVIDLGTQPSGNPTFAPARKVAFLFEVPTERIEFERDGKQFNLPRTISQIFTNSLHKKSKLRPMLESWRGRPFTVEELAGFDLKNVLGAPCMLNVIHNAGSGQNAGKTFANIASVSPLMKGAPRQTGEHPKIYFSIDDCGEKIVVPADVPEWLVGKIHQSEESIAQQRRTGKPTDEQLANRSSSENLDEDVPF